MRIRNLHKIHEMNEHANEEDHQAKASDCLLHTSIIVSESRKAFSLPSDEAAAQNFLCVRVRTGDMVNTPSE